MFQNNNKRVIKTMAKASIKASKQRNIFVIFTIALATCLITSVALYFIGTRQQAKNDSIGRPQASLVDVNDQTLIDLKKNKAIEQIGITRFIETLAVADYKLTLMYMDKSAMALNKYPDLQGRLPEAKNEIVVTEGYLRYIESSAGIRDDIMVTVDGVESAYTISGILPLKNSARNFPIITSRALVEALYDPPLYSAYINLKNSTDMKSSDLQSTISQISTSLGIGKERVVFSSYYFAIADQETTQDIGTIIAVCLLIVLACALVIYNLFYVFIIGKTQEYGRLRLIGMTKKQIKQLVFREGFYLSAIGIPIGALLGSAMGFSMVPAGWQLATVIGVVPIAIVAVYGSVVFATQRPASLAAKITPVEAVSQTSFDATINESTKHLHRKITSSRLALINLARNKKKTFFTILSLSICGVLLMSSSAYLNSINFESMARKAFPNGEFIIELGVGGSESHNQNDYVKLQKANPLNKELINSLLAIDGVETIKNYSGIVANATIPTGSTDGFTIDGYKKEDMALFNDNRVSGTVDYDEIKGNNGIVINDTSSWQEVYGWSPKLGESLTIENNNGEKKKFQIMGMVKNAIEYGGYNFLFLPDVVLASLQSETKNYNYQLVVQTKAEKREAVEEVLRNLISTNPDMDIRTLKDETEIYKNDLENQKTPIYLLVAFIGIFGIINLLNTLLTNILVRKQELSLFQTLGLSNKQLSRMLLIEGLFYSLGAIVITLTIGTGCGYLLCQVFNTIGVFGTITYQFPIWQIVTYFTILLVIQLSFSFLSIKLFKNQSLVERIRAVS